MTTELKTLFLATSPILELRGAIPVAISVYHLHPISAFLFSVIGNLIPVVLILWLIEPVSNFLSKKSKLINSFFKWLFNHTRSNHQKKFEIYKEFALVLFVAIPLPFTGGYTGAIAAFVFGIKKWVALPLIFLGIIIAGVFVTLINLSIISLI